MKITKKIAALLLCSTLVFATGCGNNDKAKEEPKEEQKTEQKSDTKEEKNAKPDAVGVVSMDKPIVVDKEHKTVTVLCSVNGKYFTENTRHASVFTKGSNGTKSVFTSYATPEEFYNGLIEIGAKPGDNMTPDNKETTHVEGDIINAKVTWTGADKEYDINDVIKDSNGKKIVFRFGGNLERAKKMNTGCLTCLDSCPVGIVSNETYTYGAVEKRNEVKFTGNKDVLPEDGTYVAMIYSLGEQAGN